METLPNGLLLAVATPDDLFNFAQPATPLERMAITLLRELQNDKNDLERDHEEVEDLQNQIAALERKQGELEDEISSDGDKIYRLESEVRNLEDTVDELQAKLNSNHNKE